MTCVLIGRPNSVPLIEAASVCRATIPDYTGVLEYDEDGNPSFSLGTGVGTSPTTSNPPEDWTPPEPKCVNLTDWECPW